jgi:hypothetical protein
LLSACRTSILNIKDGIKRLPAGAALLELVRREHNRFDLSAKALPRFETTDGFERIALRSPALPESPRTSYGAVLEVP